MPGLVRTRSPLRPGGASLTSRPDPGGAVTSQPPPPPRSTARSLPVAVLPLGLGLNGGRHSAEATAAGGTRRGVRAGRAGLSSLRKTRSSRTLQPPPGTLRLRQAPQAARPLGKQSPRPSRARIGQRWGRGRNGGQSPPVIGRRTFPSGGGACEDQVPPSSPIGLLSGGGTQLAQEVLRDTRVTHFRGSERARWLPPSSRLREPPRPRGCPGPVRPAARGLSSRRSRRHSWWDHRRAGCCSSSSRTSILCSATRC